MASRDRSPHPPPPRSRPSPDTAVAASTTSSSWRSACFLLLSNIGATKLIEFGPILTDGGAILFPLTYILGDVLTEVYGLRGARRAIIAGFAVSVLAALTFWLVQIAPPAADWPNQAAFEAVLGFVPRIVLASICGYLVGPVPQRLGAGQDQAADRARRRSGRGSSAPPWSASSPTRWCSALVAWVGVLAAPSSRSSC